MEKIEAGGELNCMSRGLGCDYKAAAGKWTTRSTLQPHWLDCTHTNWILKKPRDPSPTRPEAVYSGFREVSDKGGGWVEVRNRGVTFHPDPRLLLLPLLLQLPPCPPGGFSSLSALGGVAHRRLGEFTLPRCSSGRAKSPPGRASIYPKLHGVDLCLVFDFKHPTGGLRPAPPWHFLFFSLPHTRISISVRGCTHFPLSTD